MQLLCSKMGPFLERVLQVKNYFRGLFVWFRSFLSVWVIWYRGPFFLLGFSLNFVLEFDSRGDVTWGIGFEDNGILIKYF